MPGIGDSHQSTQSQQTQSGTISPWDQTLPQLQGILGGVNNMLPNAGLNQTQNQAIGQLENNAQTMPNYAPQTSGVINNLFSGGKDFSSTLSNGYNQYQGAMSPVMNASLDPTQTPGVSSALDTIRSDVSNSVNGMFAGAGRDLSGANQQALARGISQGEAPVLLGQYNQNVANRQGAANGLLSGAQSTAQGLSGLQQTAFGNQLTAASQAPGLFSGAQNAGPMAALQAEAQKWGIPVQQLAQLAALTIPIAGLGRQYTGNASGTSTTETDPSLLSNVGQGIGLFNNLFRPK